MLVREWIEKLKIGALDGELTAAYGSAAEAGARYLSLLEEYERRFGNGEAELVSAPGRTELAGNHTDHQNGIVLCAAVAMDTLAVASPVPDGKVTLFSRGFGEIGVDLADLAPRRSEYGGSAGIVRGVAAGMTKRGYAVGGLRGVMDSRVPAGGGLSSSAAFEVLLGALFSRFYNADAVDPMTLAIIGQGSERDYFGKPSGLMDQAASACGGITMIDFADPAAPAVERIRFDFRSAGYVLCAVDTRTSHADLTDDYAAIPREMKDVAAFFGKDALRYVNQDALDDPDTLARLEQRVSPRAIRRAKHFFAENARVPRMAEALKAGRVDEYIRLMNESGRSSRELLQNVVPSLHPEKTEMAEALDLAGSLLEGRGAWRVHGGGFAGCIQCLVPEADYGDFVRAMEAHYGRGACFELRVRPWGVHAAGQGL